MICKNKDFVFSYEIQLKDVNCMERSAPVTKVGYEAEI